MNVEHLTSDTSFNLEFCFKMNVIQLKDFFPCAIMVSR